MWESIYYLVVGGPTTLFTIYLLIRFMINFIKYHTKTKLDDLLVKTPKRVRIPNISPALFGMYTNNKRMYTNERLAMLFSLINRGYIRIETGKEFDEYRFVSNGKSDNKLCDYELLMLNLFENPLTIEEIKKEFVSKDENSKLYNFEIMVYKHKKDLPDFNFDSDDWKSEVEHKIKRWIFIIGFAISVPIMVAYFVHDVLLYLVPPMRVNYFILGGGLLIPILALLKILQTYLIEVIYYYSSFNTSNSEIYKDWLSLKKFLKSDDIVEILDPTLIEDAYVYAVVSKSQNKFLKHIEDNDSIDKDRMNILKLFNHIVKEVGQKEIKYRKNVNFIDVLSAHNSADDYFDDESIK